LRTGDGYQDADKRSARAMLAWNPSDTVAVDIAVDHTHQRQNSSGAIYDFQGFHDPTASGTDAFFDFYFRVFEDQFGVPRDGFVTNDTSLNYADFPNKDDLDILGGHVSVTWDLDAVDIVNIASYRKMHQENVGDNDGSPYFISQIALELGQEQWSEELRFSGSLANDRLEYTAGVYYYFEDLAWFAEPDGGNPFSGPLFNALEALDGPNISPPGAPAFLCPPDPLNPPPFPCFGGAGNPANFAFGPPANFFLPFLQLFDIESESYAGFVHVTYALTERFSVTLGGRYSEEEKSHRQRALQWIGPSGSNEQQKRDQVLASFPGDASLPYDVSQYRDNEVSTSWSTFAPRFALDFRVSDDFLAYASASRGFKSGHFNPNFDETCACNVQLVPVPGSGFTPAPPLKQEEVWSYELGAKTDWLDNRLRVNAAVYYSEYENMQGVTFNPQPGNPAASSWLNQADSEIYGFELEVTALPVDSLMLQLGVGLTDSELTSINPNFVIPPGARVGNIPKWNGNASVDYTIAVGGGSLTLHADYSYQSEKFGGLSPEEELGKTDSFGVVNVRGIYVSPSEKWELAVFVRNATDEGYPEGVFSVTPFISRWIVPGSPRQYGAALTYNF
jgi:iron complex outermembrane receptor protein